MKLEDKITKWSGSWKFVWIFTGWSILWFVFNVWVWAFDPYPFILFTMVISYLAIVMASIILMSQNKMMVSDRKEMRADYQINKDMFEEFKDVKGDLKKIKKKLKI